MQSRREVAAALDTGSAIAPPSWERWSRYLRDPKETVLILLLTLRLFHLLPHSLLAVLHIRS